MNRILLFLFTASVIVSLGCQSQNKQDEQPNIIYVLADDLGYGDLSCLNENSKISTPNLDKLAGQGMSFIDAHTSSSVCTPTRYGILTGRYNWRSELKKGVLNGYSKALIPESRETVASMLKKAGYYTAYIGKWHLGWNWVRDENGEIDYTKPVTNGPIELGFDYSYGHCGSLDMPPYVYVENGLATAVPDKETANKDKYAFWRKGPTAPDFVHEQVLPHYVDKAISLIKDRVGKKHPFFLYLPLPAPHTPILPTKEWQGKSGLNPYADFVMMVDDCVGKVLDAIKDAGIEGKTLVFFTSDNGCSPRANYQVLTAKGHNPSYHFRGTKADIFEGGHRVPFIVRWPGKIEAGTTSAKTICTTDLMATCADVADVKLADNMAEDSYSMLPLFSDTESKDFKRDYIVHHSIKGNFSIRKGDWKLELCPGSGGWSDPKPGNATEGLPPIQLYNLKSDIGETENLYNKYPEKIKELEQLLTKCVMDGRSTEGVVQKNDGPEKWPQLNWMDK